MTMPATGLLPNAEPTIGLISPVMTLNFASQLHVLVVERDKAVRSFLSTLLTAYGVSVSVVAEASNALALAEAKPPHAIFTSLAFADMGGFELCRRLRAMPGTSDSLIVALTGYSENGIEKRVKDAGFDHYLLKPVSLEVIVSLLDDLAKRLQADAAAGRD